MFVYHVAGGLLDFVPGKGGHIQGDGDDGDEGGDDGGGGGGPASNLLSGEREDVARALCDAFQYFVKPGQYCSIPGTVRRNADGTASVAEDATYFQAVSILPQTKSIRTHTHTKFILPILAQALATLLVKPRSQTPKLCFLSLLHYLLHLQVVLLSHQTLGSASVSWARFRSHPQRIGCTCVLVRLFFVTRQGTFEPAVLCISLRSKSCRYRRLGCLLPLPPAPVLVQLLLSLPVPPAPAPVRLLLSVPVPRVPAPVRVLMSVPVPAPPVPAPLRLLSSVPVHTATPTTSLWFSQLELR
jgi:hypothetical protein